MKRNPAIELYRVGLMFGILLLHSLSFGPIRCAWASNILASCVVGFVFISGWFGVKFSWMKLAKLYGIGLYAAFVFGLLSWMTGDVDTAGGALMLGWHKLTHGFWFLHAYAVMMMLSPAVNALIDGGGRIPSIYPILFLVWIWGFGRTLPYGADLLPMTPGLDAYGGITLTAIYAAARVCRRISIDERIKTLWLIVALPILWIATGIGLGDYNSPFAFALAAVCFLLFSRLRIPAKIGAVVVWLAPSMFSVYLIHTNEIGAKFIGTMTKRLLGFGVIPAIVLTAITVFVLAVLLDVPRRLFPMIYMRLGHRSLGKGGYISKNES